MTGILFRVRGPVVIVAGGCDGKAQAEIERYRALLYRAFDGFRGTIVSGGTTAGISGLIGDLPCPVAGAVRKLGYLPRGLPAGVEEHPAYELRRTQGDDFSPLDPIQGWIDIVASGIAPSDVKLLGISGGRIAAFEFRLALALGAGVGILGDSGRAATALVRDPEWAGVPNLTVLTFDPERARMFVHGTPHVV